MRSTTLKFLGIFAIVTAALFSACTDPCKDITCANGTCADGLCVCDAGYEGTFCDTRLTNKFVGTFNVDENCTSGTYTWQCTVTESTSELMEINFNNLYDAGVSSRAVVDTDGTSFTIPSQTFGTGTISGTGSINTSGSTITLSYTVTVGVSSDACTVTMTRI